jgi:hypothetical protein
MKDITNKTTMIECWKMVLILDRLHSRIISLRAVQLDADERLTCIFRGEPNWNVSIFRIFFITYIKARLG